MTCRQNYIPINSQLSGFFFDVVLDVFSVNVLQLWCNSVVQTNLQLPQLNGANAITKGNETKIFGKLDIVSAEV